MRVPPEYSWGPSPPLPSAGTLQASIQGTEQLHFLFFRGVLSSLGRH